MRVETSPATLTAAEARRFLRFLGLEAIGLHSNLDAESEGFILETADRVGAPVRREQ
jgi:hypothetical protein